MSVPGEPDILMAVSFTENGHFFVRDLEADYLLVGDNERAPCRNIPTIFSAAFHSESES